MLSMKTLRVAIVTMGSALLLGSGLVLAQEPTPAIDLDGEMARSAESITDRYADNTCCDRHGSNNARSDAREPMRR